MAVREGVAYSLGSQIGATLAIQSDRTLALALARRECIRVSDRVLRMAELAARNLRSGASSEGLVAARATEAQLLFDAIVSYLAASRRQHGADSQSAWLLAVLTELASIGDLLRQQEEREEKLRRAGVEFSRVGRLELAAAVSALLERMRQTFTALAVGVVALVRMVLALQRQIDASLTRIAGYLGRLPAANEGVAPRVS